ncbi:MAG: toll/interleukin-1 receptor domain-containing protein [Candidatus Hodarchaeales archaeon]|jgi:hypothetical protein
MGSGVFISYAKPDKAIADKICLELEENEIKCWIAPRDILPGMSWGEAIIDAITESKVLVLVFSSHCNISPFVLRELERAVTKGLFIVPFRIEDIRPSKGIEFFVSAAQWLNAYPVPSEEDFDILVQVVTQLTTREQGGSRGGRQNDFGKDLWLIEDLLRKEQWALSVQKCGATFEIALRELLTNLPDEPGNTDLREKIMSEIANPAQENPSFEDLTLIQLATFYIEPRIFNRLQKQKTSDLYKTKAIDWDQIVRWYNTSQQQDPTELDSSSAMEMFHWLKILLYDCELVSTVHQGKEQLNYNKDAEKQTAPKKCSRCDQKIKKIWQYCPWCAAPLNVPVSAFVHEEKDDAKRAREEYRTLCKGVYLDDVVTLRERELLNEKRLELGLTAEEAVRIENECAPKNIVDYTLLVQGVLVDGMISEPEYAFLEEKRRELGVDQWVAKQIEEVETEIRRNELNNLKQTANT